MDSEKLINWNKRGLIKGPDESEETFLFRCNRLNTLANHALSSSPKISIPLFDLSPDWISIQYRNRGLRFWEGGCAWIDQLQVTMQLRETFATKQKYLGLYSSEELLKHEGTHAVRMAFEEPIFEEILAYRTASSKFRRYFGPLFRSSKEVWVFMLLFLFLPFSFLFPQIYTFDLLVIGCFSLFGLVRLYRNQKTFLRTLQILSQILGSEEKGYAVALRLTDREIIRFSKMQREEIEAYARRLSKTCLRWKQIYLTYF